MKFMIGSVVVVRGNGLDCFAEIWCIPNGGPRKEAGHVMVNKDPNSRLCYWVEAKNVHINYEANRPRIGLM